MHKVVEIYLRKQLNRISASFVVEESQNLSFSAIKFILNTGILFFDTVFVEFYALMITLIVFPSVIMTNEV